MGQTNFKKRKRETNIRGVVVVEAQKKGTENWGHFYL